MSNKSITPALAAMFFALQFSAAEPQPNGDAKVAPEPEVISLFDGETLERQGNDQSRKNEPMFSQGRRLA